MLGVQICIQILVSESASEGTQTKKPGNLVLWNFCSVLLLPFGLSFLLISGTFKKNFTALLFHVFCLCILRIISTFHNLHHLYLELPYAVSLYLDSFAIPTANCFILLISQFKSHRKEFEGPARLCCIGH